MTRSEGLRTRHAGVMASGAGRRLTGATSSKAMVEVSGVPLIHHVLQQFMRAEIEHVHVTAQAGDHDLTEHLLSDYVGCFGSLQVLAMEPGSGAGRALHHLVRAAGDVPQLISTVDLIAPEGMARDLCVWSEERQTSGVVCVMAVSRRTEDRPTYVTTDEYGLVKAYGKNTAPSPLLYANVRWYSAEAGKHLADLPEWGAASKDSVIMNSLIDRYPDSVLAREYPIVFDIDTLSDRDAAEEWLASCVTAPCERRTVSTLLA